MSFAFDRRGVWSSLVGAASAAVLAGVLLAVAATGSSKIALAVVGGGLLILFGYLSGNVRLFCLSVLGFTLPFNLSKHFGPLILKFGGETAFRLEMSDPFLLMLGVFLYFDIKSGRRPGLQIPKVTFLWILILLAWGGAAILFGPYRMTASHEVFRMIKVMVLFLILANELQTPRRVLQFVLGMVACMVVQSVVGLAQYVTRRTFGLDWMGETSMEVINTMAQNTLQGQTVFRVSAFMLHPNVFGMFLATILPIAIVVLLLRVGKAPKLLALPAVILGIAALFATFSRSSWLAFAVGVVLLMLLLIASPITRRRSIAAATIVSLVLLVAAVPFAGKIIARIGASKSDAMRGRAEYIHDARGMIAARPWLGWGLNSYVWVLPGFTQFGAAGTRLVYGRWPMPVHHIYYLWCAETGVIGLGLHLLMWASIISMALRNLSVTDELLYAVNAACLAAMLSFILDGFFSFTLRLTSPLKQFWAMAAIIMAVHYWHIQHSTRFAGIEPVAEPPGTSGGETKEESFA